MAEAEQDRTLLPPRGAVLSPEAGKLFNFYAKSQLRVDITLVHV